MTKFNLVVPTLVIQNHGRECTDIIFERKSTGKQLLKLSGGPFWMHLQLMGVQESTYHEVRSVAA